MHKHSNKNMKASFGTKTYGSAAFENKLKNAFVTFNATWVYEQ